MQVDKGSPSVTFWSFFLDLAGYLQQDSQQLLYTFVTMIVYLKHPHVMSASHLQEAWGSFNTSSLKKKWISVFLVHMVLVLCCNIYTNIKLAIPIHYPRQSLVILL